jgi:hypothetical protein
MFIFVTIFQKNFTSDTFSKESLDKITLYSVSHMDTKATYVVVTLKTAFLLSHSGTICLHLKFMLNSY